MLLFIDNYDSFTYSLVQAFQTLGQRVRVIQGNEHSLEECLSPLPDYVVIGPGPGAPTQATLSKQLILACQDLVPLLGICLGHQALAEVYGGCVERAHYPMHGKTSEILHDEKKLFRDIPQNFLATRYHSLIVNASTIPDCLEVTARTDTHEIMGLRHRSFSQEGLQFHPESVLTDQGMVILNNFLTIFS